MVIPLRISTSGDLFCESLSDSVATLPAEGRSRLEWSSSGQYYPRRPKCLLQCAEDRHPGEGFLDDLGNTKFRSQNDGGGITPGKEKYRGFPPPRPDSIRHIKSGTVRQIEIYDIEIKQTLFDRRDSVG